jgi:hypothetical protein
VTETIRPTAASHEQAAQEILGLRLADSVPDVGGLTVREYLHRLVAAMWREGNRFSGKRPLGYADWRWPVYTAMAKAGMIASILDDEGAVADCNTSLADLLMAMAIDGIFHPATGQPETPR